MAPQDPPSGNPETASQQGATDDDAAHTSEKEAISPLLDQKAPLLRLLAPPRVSVDRTGNISVWTPSIGSELRITRVWIPRIIWVKTLKSCMLMVKVRICLQLYGDI